MLAEALKSLRAGDTDAALTTLRAFLAERPDDADGHHLLGIALRAAGDGQGAVASIDRAIELAPDSAAFHISRAAVLLDGRDLIQARTELSRALDVDPNQLSAYLMLAHFALSSGDLDEAQRLLTLAFRVDPEHPQALIVQGQLQAARGDADAGLATLTRAFERAPTDALAQSSLGLAYLSKGHFAFAGELLAKAVKQRPQARGLRWPLIQALRNQNRFEEALAELEVLLAERPEEPPALALRGDLRIQLGQIDLALADYRRVLDLVPQAQALALLSSMMGTLLNLGHGQAARELIDEQLRREPLNDLLWQARVQVEAGNLRAQVELIQRWAAALPESTAALEAQAQLAELQGDLSLARELAERACAGEGNRPRAEFILIRADIRDQPAAALPRIERALTAAQDDIGRRTARFWEGIAQDRLERPAQAVSSWRQMLRHASPALPLPVSAPAGEAPTPDGGPMPRLMWTLPGSRPDLLAAMMTALPCTLTSDRFGKLPRADGLGPVKALDRFGQPAGILPTWRRLLADRGLEPETVIEWIPSWDERLAACLPGSRLLALVRDPRDLLLNMTVFGAPQHYQVPSFEVAAAWLVQALEPLLRRHERNDPDLLLIRGEQLDDNPDAVLEWLGEFFGIERPPGFGYNRPSVTGLGGIAMTFPDGHWRHYREALSEPLQTLTPLAERLGY